MMSIQCQISAIAAIALLSGCTPDQLGAQPGPNGSAPANTQAGSTDLLEKCVKPLGVIVLDDARDPTLDKTLSSLDLPSPSEFLEAVAKKSGCFRISDGELDSRAPDLNVVVNFQWSSSSGNSIGSLADNLTGAGAIAAGLFKALSVNSAQSQLTASDSRNKRVVEKAQGSASSANMDVMSVLGDVSEGATGLAGSAGALISSVVSAAASSKSKSAPAKNPYKETNEGMIVASALVDSYNKVVVAVRAMPPMPSVQAAIRPNPASPHVWTINDEVDVLDYPADDGKPVITLDKGKAVNLTGRKHDGWTEVVDGEDWGWVPNNKLYQR